MPIPVYSESVPKLLYLNDFTSYDANQYLINNSEYLKDIEILESQYKSFRVFDSYKSFCTPVCEANTLEGKPYYFDSNHLTLTGAKVRTNI